MIVKLASWNVNGLRAVAQKPGWAWFARDEYDVIALQETKAEPSQLAPELTCKPGYHAYFCSSSVKKGYSGTAVYTKEAPMACDYELPDPQFGGEGRLIHLEFPAFHFCAGYFPNGGAPLLDPNGRPTGQFKRVPYKMAFFREFFRYAQELRTTKPVVVCGDFNIAHRPVDLANPQANRHNTGFLPEERAFLDDLINAGYADTFRLIHGDCPHCYTWWSYKTRARERNVGWRIDYFFVSAELREAVKDAGIEHTVTGADHCPVTLSLEI